MIRRGVKVGDIYGRLTVLKPTSQRSCAHVIWECQCTCGKIAFITGCSLRRSHTKSCGCLLKERISEYGRGLEDIVGRVYGRLTVVRNSGKRTHNRVLWECRCQCGKTTLQVKSSLTGGLSTSCGCLKRELARLRCKERHHNWKGGITPDHTKDRNSQQTIDWRKAVFSRDDFTCQKCKCRGGRLQSHHIEGFGSNKDKRFLLDNGITMCYGCHKAFHKKYGKEGTNTLDQLEEFLS